MSDFLPQDYVAPETSSKYLRFKDAETRFRFLTSPITGWVYWIEEDGQKMPVRTKMQPEANLKPKHFWAAVVYDWNSLSLKILEITQKTIQNAILDLNKNPKWGNPKDYDLCVVRKGDGKETEYSVMPEPKTPPLEGTLEEAQKVNLNALFEGADPFEA